MNISTSLTQKDQFYLQRSRQLAQLGTSAVFPNPQVGCVIVHDDRIIGEGYHVEAGGAHAEIRAIQSVQEPGLLKAATMYVSLEPCSFHGKTPPCSLAIARHHIPRVIIGCLDPNPKVSGRGIAYLRAQGIEVQLAPDPAPFQAINRAFFLNQQAQRPLISLKWAESLDGLVAGMDAQGTPIRTAITSSQANQQVHQMRARHHAILVGRRTAATDNPSLTVRHLPGKSPIRLVLDRHARLSTDLNLFDGSVRTIVLGAARPIQRDQLQFWQPDQWEDWPAIFQQLYQELGICSILVEGGPNLQQQLLDQSAWDQVHRFISPNLLGTGIAAPLLPYSQLGQPVSRMCGVDQWLSWEQH